MATSSFLLHSAKSIAVPIPVIKLMVATKPGGRSHCYVFTAAVGPLFHALRGVVKCSRSGARRSHKSVVRLAAVGPFLELRRLVHCICIGCPAVAPNPLRLHRGRRASFLLHYCKIRPQDAPGIAPTRTASTPATKSQLEFVRHRTDNCRPRHRITTALSPAVGV